MLLRSTTLLDGFGAEAEPVVVSVAHVERSMASGSCTEPLLSVSSNHFWNRASGDGSRSEVSSPEVWYWLCVVTLVPEVGWLDDASASLTPGAEVDAGRPPVKTGGGTKSAMMGARERMRWWDTKIEGLKQRDASVIIQAGTG